MVSSASNRKVFVHSVLEFIKKYDLDGLDLDWVLFVLFYFICTVFIIINLLLFKEYPSMEASGEADRKPGRAQDKADYIELLKELHEAFHDHGYLLTAAVSAGKETIERAYDIPQVNKYLDFINLMTYDFGYFCKLEIYIKLLILFVHSEVHGMLLLVLMPLFTTLQMQLEKLKSLQFSTPPNTGYNTA